ncbi:MAG: outer membrane lipoprotein chaperone LolA [Bdellovibrio sp.]|nr:outer membrane lipoprotein chaperone LolA [Bdellovibrio sp.]
MSQKWFQSKCTNFYQSQLRKKPLAGVIRWSLFLGAVSGFQAQAAVVNVPPLLQKIEKKYAQANTLSAEFSQLTEDVVLMKKKQSTGKIFIKRPSKVRWETLTPDRNLLVSDGTRFWYYTPPFDEGERGQVIERKTSNVQSRLANSLLSGAFSINRDMTIRQKSPTTFILIPKAGTAGTVLQATVETDPKGELIQKVTLNHRGGNKAEISLSKIQLGPQLEDGFFIFASPPNTDRVVDGG